MEEQTFNSHDLISCDIQYTTRHTSVLNFIIGEKVFLKSNPEHPMEVYNILEKKVMVFWKNDFGDNEYYSFPPECILQYKYSALITIRREYDICLN